MERIFAHHEHESRTSTRYKTLEAY